MLIWRNAINRRSWIEFSHHDRVTMEIISLSRLPSGWYFGVGEPPSKSVVSRALLMASLIRLYGATSVEVFPDSDGGILVSAYHDHETMEIFCRPDGLLDIVQEEDDLEVNSVAGIDAREVPSYLEALKWQNLFDFFIRGISVGKNIDTKASPSKTLLKEEFQSLIRNASWQPAPTYASILLRTTMPAHREIHRSSGDLTQGSFLEVAA